MLKIKHVEGIPCIVLDEEIEEKFSDFQDWKEKNDFMYFEHSKDFRNLKDVLNELKERLDENKNGE
jgi:gas vesicle protein